MAVLEQEGYLFQPHASAGRVPTDKGYRFFVDSLTGPAPLGPAQAELVRTFFARAHGEIEHMLADTSGLLSNLTDYAAVVVAPNTPEPGRVRSVQLVRLSHRARPRRGRPCQRCHREAGAQLAGEVSDDQVESASVALSDCLRGAALDRATTPRATGDPGADALAAAALMAMRSPDPGLGEHVFVGGAARMAAAFEAVSTIRQVLGILEQQYVLVTLLKDVLDRGLTVAIGAEHGIAPLADCSIVVAPYDVEGERVGTVGVLGPTRMHYGQALAAVAVVSKKLTKALSPGAPPERRRAHGDEDQRSVTHA